MAFKMKGYAYPGKSPVKQSETRKKILEKRASRIEKKFVPRSVVDAPPGQKDYTPRVEKKMLKADKLRKKADQSLAQREQAGGAWGYEDFKKYHKGDKSYEAYIDEDRDGSPMKQDDVESKDLEVSKYNKGPLATPVGPISDAEKRKVIERITDLEDRIEFISQDVDNDRVDRDKGFKRIRQFEAKIKELRKAIK